MRLCEVVLFRLRDVDGKGLFLAQGWKVELFQQSRRVHDVGQVEMGQPGPRHGFTWLLICGHFQAYANMHR